MTKKLAFQSTLPTRGSDDSASPPLTRGASISIHAPHEGERQNTHGSYPWSKHISIHAPHEGERQ